jgi:hypothetical protein
MIYKPSLNHKGSRATFKDYFACSIIVFQVCGGFLFPPFDPPPTLEGHIWLISSFLSTIQLSVGAQIVGLQFLVGHEIQRSTLQKFANLWVTKCSVTSLTTLCFKLRVDRWVSNNLSSHRSCIHSLVTWALEVQRVWSS